MPRSDGNDPAICAVAQTYVDREVVSTSLNLGLGRFEVLLGNDDRLRTDRVETIHELILASAAATSP